MMLATATVVAQLSVAQLPPAQGVKCSLATNLASRGLTGDVVKFQAGGQERCMSVIRPANTEKKALPVLFWFHGAGGSASRCGMSSSSDGTSMADLAAENDFAYICGEAIQYGTVAKSGGQWALPEVQTNATGTVCGQNQTETQYLMGMVTQLNAQGIYNTSRLYTSGCSMGSAFSGYASTCLSKLYPGSITAFATHSTGLKIKGDGNNLPPDNYNRQYSWGECPKCLYFPFVPEPAPVRAMKACIFDNAGDPSLQDPMFYRTSVQLESRWKDMGGRAEAHWGTGGHCQIHSMLDIVMCLDDGTKHLAPNGGHPHPTPPGPPPPPGPGPPGPPGPGPAPECIAACEKNCPGLKGKGAPCRTCVTKFKWDHNQEASCHGYPFQELLQDFCGAA